MDDLSDMVHGGIEQPPSPPSQSRLALPMELLGLGAAIIAVMFAGRIIDMLIIPVVGVGAYYAGRWSAKKKG